MSSGTSIDFTGAGISSSQIISAIETSLENSNAGSGSGLLSGTGTGVFHGDGNESKILLFTDGGSGSNEDVAMVIYTEGATSDMDFSGELTLANILESTSLTTLTHDNFWGWFIY